MKKFRNNLHSAFFFPGSNGNGYSENPENNEELTEEELVEVQTREDLDEHREQVQEQEFPNVAWEVSARISSKYTDMEQLKNDRKRFGARIKDETPDKKTYAEVWDRKITEWFGFLISSLKEKGYFENKNENEEIAKIKEQYKKEVYDQYEEYIWRAGNKDFNAVKDIIFGWSSQEYPADKIYKELTWATTISRVDRTHVGWYDVDVLDSISLDEGEDSAEDMSERQNRNFLSDDLPEYLWDIRKTPWVLNVLKWLPIFSVKEDRPSKVDRKAIKQFLKVSSKIEVKWNKDKAVALMEVFHDSSLNTNSWKDEYKAGLTRHGVNVEDKYVDDIVKVGSFYINTQKADNSTRDQHAIYLSVLEAIENKGWVKSAVNYFKPIVEQAKKDKKNEKKEWYETGEKLEESLKTFAEKLGISDFTSVTRLSELAKNNPNYFKNTPVEKVLANLNNDRLIDARDTIAGWSKTWAQFLTIFRQVSAEIWDKELINETTWEKWIIKWGDVVLNNLLNRAKLDNKVLWLGLDESKFTKEEIQNWNAELILLLQNIINKPGEDLYTLLSGHKGDPFEWLNLQAERASADKFAAEMVKNMKLDELKNDWLTLPNPEDMQKWLSATLYKEYSKWIGVGSKITFDQWVKWVAMNTWFQVRDDGTVVVWLGLSYAKMIDLGKWWSTTPGVSANAFIPLWYWKPELTGSVSARADIAKSWLTKENGVYAKLGIQWWVTLMPSWVIIASAWFEWERNKASDVEVKEKEKEVEFRDKIITPILNKIYEKRKNIRSPYATKLNFNDKTLVVDVKKSISEVAKEQNIPSDKEEMVTNGVIRLLLNYNNADLAQEWIRDLIAQRMAEQYAMAWAEARKTHISDTTYLSWASLGAFWIAGTPFLWIHLWIKWTKHDIDGYGDKWWREHEIEWWNLSEWTNEELDRRINQQLWLSENKKLKIENWLIAIPKSIAYRVNVNEKMQWLMKKDDNGNIFIDTHTPMAIDVRTWAATQSGELMIWWNKSSKFAKLDTLWDEWFTNEINKDKVLELGEGINTYTVDILNKALEELKKKFPAWDPIQLLDFSMFSNIQDVLDKLNALDKSKKARLSFITNEKWEVILQDPVEWDAWRWLEIEYQSRYEIIDSDAKTIADAVYLEALKLNNPAVLNAVKHKPWKEYDAFNKAMENKDYEGAKSAIVPIFKRLDNEIKDNNIKFSDILNTAEFTRLEWDALAQAMMAINNIFARSKQVRWGNWEYEFRRPNGKSKEMRAIIKERYKILNTLKSKVQDPNALEWYESLFNATSKYVDKPEFAQKSAKAGSLGNTIWFNLWDKTNPENPLFNPEIYNPMVNLDELEWFSKDAKDGLHKRAMSLFAKNPALINPVLQAAWIDTSHMNLEEVVKLDNMKINWNKCELEIDIWWKKYILSTWMKFWFFTQCVNHTIILDDISVINEDGAGVTFDSEVWEGGKRKEWNKRTIVSTTEVGIDVSVVVHDKEEPEEETETETPPETDPPTTTPWEEEEDIPTPPDATTTPWEEEEDIPGDGWSTPGADDGGTVNTWDPKTWWGWGSWTDGWWRDGDWWTTPQQWWGWQHWGGSGGRD